MKTMIKVVTIMYTTTWLLLLMWFVLALLYHRVLLVGEREREAVWHRSEMEDQNSYKTFKSYMAMSVFATFGLALLQLVLSLL